MQRYNGEARADATGALVPYPTITVYNSGTLTLSAIFQDDGVTPLANPYTGRSDGRFFFRAADGNYDVKVAGTGITTYTIGSVQLISAVVSGTGIQSINSQTGTTQTISTDGSGTDVGVTSGSNAHVINLPTSSATVRGVLNSSDWTTFNSKVGAINGLTAQNQTFLTGTSGTDFSISSFGNAHTFNLPTASASNRGLLSAADYASFAAKSSIPVGTNLQYYRGDLTWATLNTSVVPESTNLYYTDARARASLSSTAPLTYSSSTGVVAINQSTTTTDGYLAATDFTTFSNKIGTFNSLNVATQYLAIGTGGTSPNWVSNTATHTLNIPLASATATGLVNTSTQTIAGAKTFNSPITELKDTQSITLDGTFYVRNSTTTISNTATETTISTITLGGPPSANRVIALFYGGDLRVGTPAAGTFRFRIYIAGTNVWDSGNVDPTSTTTMGYNAIVRLTVRTTGASGVVSSNGFVMINDTVTTTSLIDALTSSVNLTGTPAITTTIQFSAADPTNIINAASGQAQYIN